MNGHRIYFNMDKNQKLWEKSALSKHAYECHQDNFSLENYRIMVYKQGCSTSLNRLESKTINENRLDVLGFNRMKIQKE